MNPSEQAKSVRDRLAHEYEESKTFQIVAWIMLFGVLSAICVIAWLNIAPYVALFQSFGVGDNWLTGLIGGITRSWGKIVLTIAGLLLWALVQSMQCLWLVIRNDRKAMRGAISNYRRTQLQADRADAANTRQLIKKHNRVPYFFLRWSGFLSLGATAFDFILNFGYYPPAKDATTFIFAITSGMWQLIDGTNLAKLLVSVLLFEVLLILAIVIWQWIQTSKAEKETAA